MTRLQIVSALAALAGCAACGGAIQSNFAPTYGPTPEPFNPAPVTVPTMTVHFVAAPGVDVDAIHTSWDEHVGHHASRAHPVAGCSHVPCTLELPRMDRLRFDLDSVLIYVHGGGVGTLHWVTRDLAAGSTVEVHAAHLSPATFYVSLLSLVAGFGFAALTGISFATPSGHASVCNDATCDAGVALAGGSLALAGLITGAVLMARDSLNTLHRLTVVPARGAQVF